METPPIGGASRPSPLSLTATATVPRAEEQEISPAEEQEPPVQQEPPEPVTPTHANTPPLLHLSPFASPRIPFVMESIPKVGLVVHGGRRSNSCHRPDAVSFAAPFGLVRA